MSLYPLGAVYDSQSGVALALDMAQPAQYRISCHAGTKPFKATLLQVLKGDDGRVVGIHRNTAERNGKRLDVGCCIVFEFKDGRVTDGREHFYDLHAWDEFWR